MAENPHGAPIYGHPGTPTYRDHRWQWTAPDDHGPHLIPVDRGLLLQPPLPHPAGTHDTVAAGEHLNNAEVKRLSYNFPSLTSTLPFLRPWVVDNFHPGHRDETFDSFPVTCITIGLLARAKATAAPVPVVILPDPIFLDAFRFKLGVLRSQGWDHQGSESSHWIERLDVSGRFESIGRTGNTAYRQLCLSSSRDAKTPSRFLAVRSTTTISIFAPTVQVVAHSTYRPTFTKEASAPSVDLNYLESLPVPVHPFADMAFDPLNENQLLTIDEAGQWRLWNVNIRPPEVRRDVKSPKPNNILLLQQGSTANDETDGSMTAMLDGWHRVLWVNAHLFVACNRRHVWLVQLRPIQTVVGPQLRAEDEAILDLQKAPGNTDVFFLLTTTDFYCLTIVNHDNGSHSLVATTNWHHGRDASDHTLRCVVQAQERTKSPTSDQTSKVDRAAETCLILALFSKQTSIISQYCCYVSDNRDFRVTRPRLLNLFKSNVLRSKTNDKFAAHDQIQDLVIRPVRYIQRPSTVAESQTDTFEHSDTHFYQILVYSQCHAFGELLCYTARDHDLQLDADEFDWATKSSTRRRAKRSTRGELQELDDFIVSEDSESDSLEDSGGEVSIAQQPKTSFVAIQYPRIYQQICNFDLDRQLDLGSTLDGFKGAWENRIGAVSQRLQLLSQCVPSDAVFGDVDEASDAVDAFVASHPVFNAQTGAEMSIKFLSQPSNLMPAGFASGQGSISQLYRQIIQNWISPLSQDTPGKVRLLRQRLAKSISTTVTLSSVALVPKPSLDTDESTTHNASDLVSAVQRLQKYTYLRDDGPTLNKSLHKVLTHWSLGEDPSAYDFESTQETLSGVPRELRHLSPGAQARLQRRIQREAERQLRRPGGASSQPASTPAISFGASSSQATLATQRSQQSKEETRPGAGRQAIRHISSTQPIPAGSDSQRQVASQAQPQIVASQIEQGRHARRLDSRNPRGKPAGRKAGF